jgi:hypothetical protein
MEAPPHSSIADKAAVIRSRVARELRYPPRVAEATQTNFAFADAGADYGETSPISALLDGHPRSP